MADVSLVCMREDAWKADLLTDALERYGFTVCRSASVFEDFQGYAAVVVLLSPGAARSELVMQTAARAMDWGKLIPVFVNLCRLPDRLAGVALHDLSAWEGAAEDPVVRAIAYHAQRLAGIPGKPVLGAEMAHRPAAPLALEHYEPTRAFIAPPQANYEHDYGAYGVRSEPDYQAPYAYDRGYTPPEPYFVASAHNQLDYHPPARSNFRPVDVHVAVSPNDTAAQRRAYFMERAGFMDAPRAGFDIGHDVADEPPPRQRRPLSGLFTVLISAALLMGMAYIEEARTREVQLLRATPAEATAILTKPANIDTSDTPRHMIARR